VVVAPFSRSDPAASNRRHSVASNDVSEAFEELVRWYASQVAPNEDPAAVVDVLLAASDLD